MKPIVILADGRRLGTCRSCGAAVEWATVAASHAVMPFNRPIVLTPALPGVERAVASVDMTKTTSHMATCPQAAQWRTRARR